MPAESIPEHWLRRTGLAYALWPVSLVYGALVQARRCLYRSGMLRAFHPGVPVVVIGNIFVGGTGKTPLTLALARLLREKGFRPGILASGYGGRRARPAQVFPDSDPLEAGDEAVLLAASSGVPVWSGRDRVESARQLLASYPDCDVILCDDGLQHYRLARDCEIEVRDERGHGNGFLLPAGPLREPASRPVDARVVTGGRQPPSGAGKGEPVFGMELVPRTLYRLDEPALEVMPADLRGKRLHAVAGTGNPRRFFDTLAELGLQVTPHPFPDHHAYTAADLQYVDCDAVLMTEKDAVKCRRFPLKDLYALRVEAKLDPGLVELVLSRIGGPAGRTTRSCADA